ncbi:MAG TPA: M42 family metallopeptidase [Bacillota bacterium]|nr:M42 family metallopeptidase [Bacillota bacterium]HOL09499.1 M42 family metallopeptidase [Bacillota bacterium]HPO97539.1 M42 family metallopeptidase [Bacillota bacterium]
MTETEKLLIELCDAFGPSGFEAEIREIFIKNLQDKTEISFDNLGSVLAFHRGSLEQPKILLAAHLDEVGLMVRGILPGGQLKVVPLGGWWAPALVAQQMLVRSKKGTFPGVVGAKPPHYLRKEEEGRQLRVEDLYIDIGASDRSQVEAWGIQPGDPVVPAVKTKKLDNKMLMGKAFDDRVGCAIIIRLLQELEHNHPNLAIGAGTVQEEVGAKGAQALSNHVLPDVCIVIEGAPADDFPDSGSIIQGKTGAGPQLRRFDPTMIANQALVDLVINEAQQLNLPYQVAVREGGGTDGSTIQVQTTGGVPTMVIGVPVRYAHSHHGMINLDDVENTIKLVKSLIYKLDKDTVRELKRNPW